MKDGKGAPLKKIQIKKQPETKDDKKQDTMLSNFFTFISMIAIISFFYLLASANHYNSGKDFFDKYPVVESIAGVFCICSLLIICTFEYKSKWRKDVGRVDTLRQRFFQIWEKLSLQFELVHLIVFVLLWLALEYEDKIPKIIEHNEQIISLVKTPIQDVYDQVFGIFFLGRLFVQINELNGKNFGTKGKIFQNVLSTASGLGLIIIEACIVEIVFTKETLFQKLLFGPLDASA